MRWHWLGCTALCAAAALAMAVERDPTPIWQHFLSRDDAVRTALPSASSRTAYRMLFVVPRVMQAIA